MKKKKLIKIYLCEICAEPIARQTALYFGGKCGKCKRLGIKHSQATKDKIGNANRGRKLSEKTKEKISKSRKGKYLGKNNPNFGNHKLKGENNPNFGNHKLKGKNNPMYGKYGAESSNWRGGITPLHRLIRTCDKYNQWRLRIFKKDDFTCQYCGERGCY